MPSVSEHVHIDRPIEVVWAFVADSANTPRWNPLWEQQEVIGGGAMGLGAVFSNVGHVAGRRIEVEAEVTCWDPPRRSSVRTVTGPIDATGSYVLRPEGGGTGFTWQLEAASELGGVLGRFTGAVVIRLGFQGLRAGLERLRAILEDQVVDQLAHHAASPPIASAASGTSRIRGGP